MDPKLQKAAATGNIGILKQFLKDCEGKGDYSVILSPCEENSEETGTILHVAAWNGKAEFLKEALTELSKHGHAEYLICYREQYGSNLGYNLLHVAAKLGSLEMVQAITGYYKRRINNNKQLASKPWLKKDIQGSTPLHIALKHSNQDCAMEILSLDLVSHCNSLDNFDNSPLFLAVKYGHDEVAKKILNDAPRCSTTGEHDFTPLHFAPNCSVEVCKLLLLKKVKPHSNASSIAQQPILHNWIELEKESMLFKQLLNEDCTDEKITSYLVNLISECDKDNNNAFHILARDQKMKSSKILADFYNKYKGKNKEKDLPPWLKQNKSCRTPLHLALEHDSKDAIEWLGETIGDAAFDSTKDGPLVLAVRRTRHDLAMRIGQTLAQYGWSPFCPDGMKIWHVQGDDRNDVEIAQWLVKNLPTLIQEEDVEDALKYASEQDYHWLVESVLHQHHDALEKYPMAWIKACQRGHYKTIVAFINNCSNFRRICIANGTSPLHKVKFTSSEDYRRLLENPVIKGLTNFQDHGGAAPLHHAIETKNTELAEALLNTDNLNLDLEDNQKLTPLNLLHNVRGQKKWVSICGRYGIVPGYNLNYYQNNGAPQEARSTLSVVAALLATITFTAGFTVPGGFDQNNGDVLLGNKAAFIVFILFDSLAMFCSFLMMVFLMLSVISNRAKSLMFIDKSLSLLMAALVCTVVAFMTGVYLVLRKKCLWVAILIVVLCSLFILVILATLYYAINHVRIPKRVLHLGSSNDVHRDMEQGLGASADEDRTITTEQENHSVWKKLFRCFRVCRCSCQTKSQ